MRCLRVSVSYLGIRAVCSITDGSVPVFQCCAFMKSWLTRRPLLHVSITKCWRLHTIIVVSGKLDQLPRTALLTRSATEPDFRICTNPAAADNTTLISLLQKMLLMYRVSTNLFARQDVTMTQSRSTLGASCEAGAACGGDWGSMCEALNFSLSG